MRGTCQILIRQFANLCEQGVSYQIRNLSAARSGCCMTQQSSGEACGSAANEKGSRTYLIEDAVVKVHPHGLLLAQVDFKHIQLPPVEAVGCLLQSLAVCFRLDGVFALQQSMPCSLTSVAEDVLILCIVHTLTLVGRAPITKLLGSCRHDELCTGKSLMLCVATSNSYCSSMLQPS